MHSHRSQAQIKGNAILQEVGSRQSRRKVDGENRRKIEVAKNLIKLQYPMTDIIDATGFTREQTNQMKREIRS